MLQSSPYANGEITFTYNSANVAPYTPDKNTETLQQIEAYLSELQSRHLPIYANRM